MPEIKPMPKTPFLPTDLGDGNTLIKALWDHIVKNNQTINALIAKVQELEARLP